jgi:transcription elongation GreA/GreB family factor
MNARPAPCVLAFALQPTQSAPVDKAALLHAIIAQLEAALALQTEAAHDSHDEATHEENRAEDKYDMRSQSAAYLAAGQAQFATAIAGALAAYRHLSPRAFAPGEAIAVGAVVTLEAQGRQTVCYLGPQHGGLEVVVHGVPATVVTAFSPVGRRLVGRQAGDRVYLPGHPKAVEHRILAVG